ncbi:cell division protein FtsQ [Alteromonadaceae bacterium 2753L.S.0a.02]|nr:cell division protein FtsQ [Alteromonadaceae bacterium 2753L.S.0a.02]
MKVKPGTRKQRSRASARSQSEPKRKSASRGASVKAKKTQLNWYGFFVCVGWGAMICGMLAIFVFVDWSKGLDKVQAVVNRPVSTISIKGEFSHLSKQHIQELVVEQMKGDFVDLNLRRMREAIERDTWVRRAGVRRVWPDRLEITVTEQKPIARWGNFGFINSEGKIIDIGSNHNLAGLPLFYGPAQKSEEITKTYLAISEMLSQDGLGVVGIQVDDTLSWRLHLSDDLELVIGQYDVLDKLKNFMLVYRKDLVQKKQLLARIDMRYENGMAVSWRNQDAMQLQASR